MISKTRYEEGRLYVCDDCNKEVTHFKNYEAARAAGWAVSWERAYCYCPTCATYHRRGSAMKKDKITLQTAVTISR